MSKKLLFIVNPRAGRNKSRAPLFDAAATFCAAGYLVDIRLTRRHGDAARMVRELGADYDLIVCHGGDGTLNETVNGLMSLPAERRAQISYLPGGSTNDFAASLSISGDPAAAARDAMRMQPRRLDVGRFGERYFVYVASFGAFTRTAYAVPQDVKNVFGHFAYILEGVRDLDTLRPYRMRLTADGEVFDGEFLFGAVSNSTSIAGMMKLPAENVGFDDGVFEMLLVPVPKTPGQLQSITRALLYQELADSEGLFFRHVKSVTAETEENIPWTLDGEYVPGAPRIEISIENGGIELLL